MMKLFVFILFLGSFQTVFPSPNYSMQISNTAILNDSTISFEVYINSNDSSFTLTSYQCVFTIDNSLPVYGFSFVKGSSDLAKIVPSAGIGISNIDGAIKLTFASLPGSEIITSNNLRVGEFLIKTRIIKKNSIPQLGWCFDSKINTLLTGSDFVDITNQENFSIRNRGRIKIHEVLASTTTDANTSPGKTIDGKGANDGDPNSRWAAQPMPAYLIFDLDSVQNVSETKFSFYEWNNERIYHYSISTSIDSINWNEIIVNDSSSSEEWTINAINKDARFIKLTFLSNNQCDWAGLWEAQILGPEEITEVNNEQENIHNKIPNDYTLSQNYPNPFNPTTKINFSLAEEGKVDLEVYNILGEKVSTLVNQDMSAGSHEVNFNASNLASGIYIYRINVNNKFTDTRKMILMK